MRTVLAVILLAAVASAEAQANRPRLRLWKGKSCTASSTVAGHWPSRAVDGNPGTYFRSAQESQPWLACTYRKRKAKDIQVHAVSLTAPPKPSFKQTDVHDIHIRVGSEVPSKGGDPSSISKACAIVSSQVFKRPGQVVRVACEAPVVGSIVTVQIRHAPTARRSLLQSANNTLSLSDVAAQGAAVADSYVISVAHQTGGSQPYARACQTRQISITIGTGANAKPYNFTIDTGSGLLELSCNTPQSQANCGGAKNTANYKLIPAATINDTAQCDAAGVGCQLPNGQCYYTQRLTGGNGINGHSGLFASDLVTISNSNPSLSFQGTFSCDLEAWFCGQEDQTCQDNAMACPTHQPSFAGKCTGNGQGVEAGFTFSLGDDASAVAIPEQVFNAGLLSQKILGICWQQPQKDASCAATVAPNSYVVLGPALPSAVSNASQLSAAPLYNAIAPPNPASAAASTHTFRSKVTGVSVPVFNSTQPWVGPFTSAKPTSILWDTGAYGHNMVPASVLPHFVSYYKAARAQAVASNPGLTFQTCAQAGLSASYVCGNDVPAAGYGCQFIPLKNPTQQQINNAKAMLASMYPPSIDISLIGGDVAHIPTAVTLNVCTGVGFTTTQGVAACSYVQADPTPGSYFWVAGPWFNNRFSQFDVSQPAAADPSSIGTMYFSDIINSCAFPDD